MPILIVILISILASLAWVALYAYYKSVLPENLNNVINEAREEKLPKFIGDNTGYVDNDGITIFYEVIGKDQTKVEPA